MRSLSLLNLGAVQDPTVRAALQDINTASQQNQQAPIANNTVAGNVSGSNAQPSALSQAQLTALINLFSSSASGAVPASGNAGSGQFLNAAGQWATPSQAGTFTAAAAGLVPASGGGTQNFMRADGQWAAPPQASAGLKTFINITDPLFGGVGDGRTDNTAALVLAYVYALEVLPAGGKIYFPAGRYFFSQPVTLTFPNQTFIKLAIVGDGADSSVLFWSTGGGLTINYQSPINVNNQSFDCIDLSFTTGSNGLGTALTLNQLGAVASTYGPQTNLINVSFRGDDGYARFNYWADGCVVTGISNINLRGCTFQGPAGTPAGIGLVYRGLFISALAVVMNLEDCIFNQLAHGFEPGDFIQGITIDDCNFTGNFAHIFNAAGLSNTLGLLAISNSQFGTFGASNGILLQSAWNTLQLVNNTFILTVGGSGCIDLGACSNFSITGGNQFTGFSYPVASAVYTSSSGDLALTFATAPTGLLVGDVVRLFALSGTGSVNSLNGTWIISGLVGSTVHMITTAGLTLTITAGTGRLVAGTVGISVVNGSATGGVISDNVFVSIAEAVVLPSGSQNINAGFGNTFVLCGLPGGAPIINGGTNNLVTGGNLVT